MDLNKLSQLKVIKPKKDVDSNIEANISNPSLNQPEIKSGNSIIQLNSIDRINSIMTSYQNVRKGIIDESEFQKNIEKFDKRIHQDIDNNIKHQVKIILIQTLKWYIQLKLLLSTGLKAESLIDFIGDISRVDTANRYSHLKLESIKQLIESLDNPETFQDKNNPKESSNAIRNLLKIFVDDDNFRPVYKIDSDMISYLSNYRPTFLKEITVLFDLYSKVYDQFSKDLLEDKLYRKISDIQPRFEMINRHILSSNLSTKIDYNLDLNKLDITGSGKEQFSEYVNNIESSQLGLQKRLNFLNEWLINGIIHTQASLNRLNGLKPITQEGKSKILNEYSNKTANSKYEIWLILQDTKAFLESLKGLTDGTAFITGMQSNELLDILDTNY